MNLQIEPGNYVVAVSGGVDSIVLLDLLAQQAQALGDRQGGRLRLTVAHFDHGIRTESLADRLFVQKLAHRYGLPFVYNEGHLGPAASEAAARFARYNFLQQVLTSAKARAILTAHHQDDVLETALVNLLRGTGRKGLSSLADRDKLRRPLLDISKRELLDYAQRHRLEWHEDSTNRDKKYTRNYIRHALLTRFDDNARQQLLRLIDRQRQLNQELDQLLINQLHLQSQRGRLDRRWFNQLPHEVAAEIIAIWLRLYGVGDFTANTIERLVIGAKVLPSGRYIDVVNGVRLSIGHKLLALQGPER